MHSAVSPLIVYAITMFTSALLLFLVQPMIGKQILPKFGGAPAVWSTCMVFYQGVLLAGYAYAHYITKRYSLRKQVLIHLSILALPLLAFAILPIGFAYKGLNPPTDQNPALWVLIILTMLIGLPFFVVSTSAPLFQRWFGQTGHEAAKDPYFLYAASNLGSMISLILYPFFIELKMSLPAQGLLWMVGYGLLAGLAGWCGLMVLRRAPADEEVREAKVLVEAPVMAPPEEVETKALADAPEGDTETEDESVTDKPQVVVKSKKMRAKDRAKAATLEAITTKEPSPPAKDPSPYENGPSKPVSPAVAAGPSPIQYLRWILLGFVPSSLMLGVTMYMSTDVAAVPLLWLIPLAIYLLSFILVFSQSTDVVFRGMLYPFVGALKTIKSLRPGLERTFPEVTFHSFMCLIMPVVVLLMVFQTTSGRELLGTSSIIWRFVIHLLVMFVLAMVCHGELARTRPPAEYLTGFYLAMSVGGVLGGIFNAIIAPLIFNTVAEYSLVLVVACMLLPPLWEETRSRFNQIVDIFLAVALGGAGAFVVLLYVARFLDLDFGRGSYEILPLFNAVPGMQVQWVGFLAILGFAAAYFAYVSRAPRGQQLERALDVGLPAALCLLSLFIMAKEPFASWTTKTSNLFALIQSGVKLVGIRYDDGMLQSIFTFGIPVALCYGFAERPIRLGLGVGAILLASALQKPVEDYGRYVDETVYKERSFFGVLKVEHQKFKVLVDGDKIGYRTVYHKLLHGTTLHGMQRALWERDGEDFAIVARPLAFSTPLEVLAAWGLVAERTTDPRQEALTYYHRTGPIGQVYKALISGKDATHPVAFIGLGTGTMASYCNPGQKVTFYEIDEAVVRIAENPQHFTYLQGCKERGGAYEFKMGDARLMMEKAPDKTYKLIVVDAFSSDAIPIHLTNKEAIELYLRKLTDNGVVAMHISNRHLELEPVLANIAADLDVAAIEQYDNKDRDHPGKNASDWVMISKKMENFGPLLDGLWRWPDDSDRRWKNLLLHGDAKSLSTKDLDDWKRQDVAARRGFHRSQVDDETTLEDPDFRKACLQRIQKLDHVPTEQEELAIRREEYNKLVDTRTDARMAAYKETLDKKKETEIRDLIQTEIDRRWDRNQKWRDRVGVWTDDFSNILSIWRDFNRDVN